MYEFESRVITPVHAYPDDSWKVSLVVYDIILRTETITTSGKIRIVLIKHARLAPASTGMSGYWKNQRGNSYEAWVPCEVFCFQSCRYRDMLLVESLPRYHQENMPRPSNVPAVSSGLMVSEVVLHHFLHVGS